MKLKKIYKNNPFTVLSVLSYVTPKEYNFYDYIYGSKSEWGRQYNFNMFLYNKYRDFSYFNKECVVDKGGAYLILPVEKKRNADDWDDFFRNTWDMYVKRYGDEIDKILDALLIEFAPLDNYDKTSTITTTDNDRTSTTKGKITNHMGGVKNAYGEMINGQLVNDELEVSQKGVETTTTTTPSFDIDTTKKSETKHEVGEFGESMITRTKNPTTQTTQIANDDSFTDYGTDGLKEIKTGNTVVTEHTHGNIGVTTSSKMLEEYVLTRIRYNLWEFIAETYADMFLYLK